MREKPPTGHNAKSVVKRIFETDKRIQFCALVDSRGKIESGGMRPGVQSLEPSDETHRIVARSWLRRQISAADDIYLGSVSWVIIRRKKVLQITFPLSKNRQLQIAAAPSYPISKLPALTRFVSSLGLLSQDQEQHR